MHELPFVIKPRRFCSNQERFIYMLISGTPDQAERYNRCRPSMLSYVNNNKAESY